MARHVIERISAHLHSRFDRELEPIVEVGSGDTVVLSTPDVAGGIGQHGALGEPRDKLAPRDGELGTAPVLVGPIAVRGAEAGMVLAVHIERVVTADWGWTWAGKTETNAAFLGALGLRDDSGLLLRWSLDQDARLAHSENGFSVPLRPFPGIVGLAPGTPGRHLAWPPRRTAGNLDCRELVAGSTLYIPVEAPGALLSAGDGHAAQGDGEVAGSAIECPLETLELRLALQPAAANRAPPASPRAHTPAGWLTFGFDEDLSRATTAALDDMLALLAELYSVPRTEALALASAAVDLRVTQLVNGVVGVHAVLAANRLHSCGD